MIPRKDLLKYNDMGYNDLTLEDDLQIRRYYKKWGLFSVIARLFCSHFRKRNGVYGKVDIHTCVKCGKNYYQDNPWDEPPISYIINGENKV